MRNNHEIDMINGPLTGKILTFALPLMLSGILQLLYNAADIVDKYMGAGWSCNTPESENEVLEFVRTEGIYIENVYTSKLMYGYKDMVKNNLVDGDSAVIHTGGFGSLFSQY